MSPQRTALVLVAVVLLLSGCVRIEEHLAIRSDGTASMLFRMFVPRDAADDMQLESREDFDRYVADFFGLGTFTSIDELEYRSEVIGDERVYEAHISSLPVDVRQASRGALDGQGHSFPSVLAASVTVDGDVYEVQAPVELFTYSLLQGFEPAPSSFRVVIDVPSEVVAHNGRLEGRSVVWDDLSTVPETLSVSWRAPESGSRTALVVSVAVVAVVLVAVGAWLLRSRRRGGRGARRPPDQAPGSVA